MLIKQRRIRSLSLPPSLKEWDSISFWINLGNIDKSRLKLCWILSIPDNVLFLPPILWPISKFNAEWKDEKQKNLPKEVHYREVSWTRELIARWHSTGKIITSICEIPYKKYPVISVEPVGVELFKREWRLYWPVLTLWKDNEKIKHTINLFLELFWECEVLSENLEPLINTWKIRYNWEFIKPWEWEEFKRKVMNVAQNKSASQRKIIERRITVAEKLWLSPVGVWVLWFRWYIAFQSKDKKYTIFENVNYGNAIYITDMNREEFSKQDKQTILSTKIQKDRIIHRKRWENRLKQYC